MPPACIGRSNYVYVYGRTDFFVTAQDYFCLSAVTSFGGGASPSANPGLTVQEAYNIDRKIDDGLPQSGRVTAQYANAPIQTNLPVWAAGGGVQGANGGGLPSQPTTAATPGSSTTCYDNGNSTNAQQYSITQSNGSYVNCALSFMFQ